MTLQEAREVLGVGREATRDEVRRAYLRGVREHRPERDPEGFRRVREAYETLRSLEGLEQQDLEDQGVGNQGIENQGLEDRDLQRVPLEGTGPPTEPGRGDGIELSGPSPGEIPPTGGDWRIVEDRETVEAARERWLESLEDLLDTPPGAGEAPPAPPEHLLAAALHGVVLGRLEGSRRLVGYLRDHLGQELGDALQADSRLTLWWVGVRELLALPESFPQELRAAMAGALFEVDFSAASDTLHDFVQRSSRRALRASEELEAHAPILNEQFGDLLSGPRSQRYANKAWGGFGVGLLIFLVLRTFLSIGSCQTEKPTGPLIDFQDYPPGAVQSHWSRSLGDWETQARIRLLCDGAPGPQASRCARARGVAQALEAGRCRAAREHLVALRDLVDPAVTGIDPETDPTADLYTWADQAFTRRCERGSP